MSLIDPFLQMAHAAELHNAGEYDPVAPTFVAHAGNYALVISAMPSGGEFDAIDARVSIGFGLDKSGAQDDIANLVMRFEPVMGVWLFEFDLKGEDPPEALRALASRYGLTNVDESVGLVRQDQPTEVAQAMVDFIKSEVERIVNRPHALLSKVPLPDFIARGGRLP